MVWCKKINIYSYSKTGDKLERYLGLKDKYDKGWGLAKHKFTTFALN